jgi:hypothetical protein
MTDDDRALASARRWYEAFRATLGTKLAVERPANEDEAAFELFLLLAEEIPDLATRRRFAWLFSNNGDETEMPTGI